MCYTRATQYMYGGTCDKWLHAVLVAEVPTTNLQYVLDNGIYYYVYSICKSMQTWRNSSFYINFVFSSCETNFIGKKKNVMLIDYSDNSDYLCRCGER